MINKVLTGKLMRSCFVLTVTAFFLSCLPRNVKNKEIETYSQSQEFTHFNSHTLKSGKEVRTIYTSRDSIAKPLLVFIHGAPGNLLNFKRYHEDSLLNSSYNILSYDRPGYGTRKGGRAVGELPKQSEILTEILENYSSDTIVLFAHSFGGAVALRHATENKKVKSLFLCAVAVDPENEKYFWFSKIGKWWFTRWLLPRYLKTTGSEKFSHEDELKRLKPLLNNISCQVNIYHGDIDEVVPIENVVYLEKELNNAKIKTQIFNNVGHFFPIGYKSIMVGELLELYN